MILREIFVRTIPFGEESIFSIRNNWSLLSFYVLFLLVKGYLKVWVMVWLVMKSSLHFVFQMCRLLFIFQVAYTRSASTISLNTFECPRRLG